MNNYRNLIEGAKVIAPPNPGVAARLKQQKDISQFMATKGLQFSRAGIRLEYIFKHKNRWIIDTKHAAERIVERGQLSIKDMEFFFRNLIEAYLKGNSNNSKILFFSKSLNQGMVIDVRKDYKKIDNQKHFVIITFLPRGKKEAKKGTDTILLETLYPGYEIIICD